MSFTRFARYLDSFYTQKGVPGLGVAVYHRNQPVFEHYAGYSDVAARIPFGPDTHFKLYSATKLSTCTAALQLVEQGKLRLKAPLGEYMPEYRRMSVLKQFDGRDEIVPAGQDITVEHLFTMSAGISGDLSHPAVKDVLDSTAGRAPTLAIARAMAAAPLLFEPGSHFKYGVCHDILGALVELVSGERLSDYVRNHITGPLGMDSTTYDRAVEADPRFAKLYIGFDGKTSTWEAEAETLGHLINIGPDYECGGGGVYSTVPDYIRFAAALANGGVGPNGARILQASTIDDMRTNRMRGEALTDFEQMVGWSKAGYGYGLGVRTLLWPERANSLSEVGEFGWDGARGCFVLADPKAEVAIFYAQQEGKWPWWEWHGMVRNMAYASLEL